MFLQYKFVKYFVYDQPIYKLNILIQQINKVKKPKNFTDQQNKNILKTFDDDETIRKSHVNIIILAEVTCPNQGTCIEMVKIKNTYFKGL